MKNLRTYTHFETLQKNEQPHTVNCTVQLVCQIGRQPDTRPCRAGCLKRNFRRNRNHAELVVWFGWTHCGWGGLSWALWLCMWEISEYLWERRGQPEEVRACREKKYNPVPCNCCQQVNCWFDLFFSLQLVLNFQVYVIILIALHFNLRCMCEKSSSFNFNQLLLKLK